VNDPDPDSTPELTPAPSGPPAQGAPADPAVRPSRAGRDLSAAIAVGVGLGAVVLVALLVQPVVFVGVVVLAAAMGVRELALALASSQIRVPAVPVTLGGAAMLVGAWAGGAQPLVAALGLSVLGLFIWRLPGGSAGYVRDTTAAVFVLAYVPLLGSFVLLMLRPDDGAMRVIAFVVCAVASDTGGYAVGALFGRHPMAPTISPKKSWEGFMGSLTACAVAGWLTVSYGLDGPFWVGVLLGVVTAVGATVGDLSESLLKRDLGLKDMGALLPGHGGLMDRLDSLLFVAPLAWLVLDTLVPVA